VAKTLGYLANTLLESSTSWEHPVTNSWDAVAILLFSAAVLDTTDPSILATFTGYDLGFICAVAWNMRNNNLWTATEYKPQDWSKAEGIDDFSSFWEEVSVGCGDLWFQGAENQISVDAGMMPFAPCRKDRSSELESERSRSVPESESVH
jgi:hypothetical protein